MKQYRTFHSVLILLALLTLAGCGKKALSTQPVAEDGRVMVRGDRGYSLTAKDFYAHLVQSALAPTGGTLPDSTTRWFLDSLLVDTLTGFEADSLDLSRYFHSFWSYRTRVHSLMLYTSMEKQFGELKVDSAEVQAFYDANRRRYNIPEQVEVSHIMANRHGMMHGADSLTLRLLPAEEVEKMAFDLIKEVHRKLDLGAIFDDLARTYSHERDVQNTAGYLGWTGRGQFHHPFDSIAFGMRPGQYSAPYQDQDGWHIVYLHAKRDSGIIPLSDSMVYSHAERTALSEKIRQAAAQLMDSLSRDVKIVVNESLLDSNLYHTTDSLWFGIINDVDTVEVLTMRNAEEGLKSRLKVWNTTPEQKRDVLKSLARQYCAIQAARRDGLDTLESVRAKLAEMNHQESKLVLINQWFDKDWKPSDEMIKAYYDANPKKFIIDKPLTVQQIVTKDSALAIFIRDQARSGVEFLDLAKEYYPGEEAIRVELADLGKVGPNDVDTAFYKAAYIMMPGDISEPVKTRYGFHIIKVLKHEDSRSLEDAKVEIENLLKAEHQMAGFTKLRDKLFKKYRIKISMVPKSVFLEPIVYRKK